MMNKKTIAAAVGVGAVALGAVGVAIAITPANAEPTSSAASTSTVQSASDQSANVQSASPERVQGKARGTTVVTFTEGAVAALAPLNPSAFKPGAFGFDANDQTVQGVFPIVGNAKAGVISHVGGLTLTDNNSIVTLSNYKIDTNKGVLTANGFVNGAKLTRINFLNVELTKPTSGCDASANLTLAAPAAKALSAVFDAPDLTGAAIGTACINFR